MKSALSVRQPWAAALLYGIKPVENRTWPLPPKYANNPQGTAPAPLFRRMVGASF